MANFRYAAALTLALVATFAWPPDAQGGQNEPSARKVADWSVDGELAGANDLSGIACAAPGEETSCLVASDEVRSLQCVRLSQRQGRSVKAGRSVEAFASGDEFDAEGITHADGYYYVIGSHALSRKERLQPNRFHIVRIADTACGSTAAAKISRSTLTDAISNQPALAPYLRRPIDKNGINIEGIAVHDGALYFGFRSPSIEGRAPVLSLPTGSAFPTGATQAGISWLDLGEDMGVRDLARVSDGLLVLVGNSSTASDPREPEQSRAAVYHWKPSHTAATAAGGASPVRFLASLPGTVAKPEGLLLLAESAAEYRILVVSDSATDGRPTEYAIARVDSSERSR